MAEALAGPAPTSSATAATPSSSLSSTASNSTKRIVQYYGSPLAFSNHIHITQLVNSTGPSTRPTYSSAPSRSSTTTQLRSRRARTASGSPTIQRSTRPGPSCARCSKQASLCSCSCVAASTCSTTRRHFDARYAPLHALLTRHKLDGIDLDIEDDPITLNATVTLIRRLRADFGAGFVITLAPVATVFTASLINGDNIAWYNAQFYGTSDLTTELFDDVVSSGWDPTRFTIGMATSPDFHTGIFPLSDLHAVFANITATHPRVRGIAGLDVRGTSPKLALLEQG
ncbi:glycoside hydrolase superfamily [Mycena sanguinolenta]|nr:glycoside hydrolase superfamily [Mycena sanguinolenta]